MDIMNNYELMFIVKPSLAPKDKEMLLDKLSKLIEKEKGKVDKTTDLGKKVFSYPIKKYTEGVYIFLELKLAADKINILDKKLKIEENIIRYLLVKNDA